MKREQRKNILYVYEEEKKCPSSSPVLAFLVSESAYEGKMTWDFTIVVDSV
jgi:hypothetical protein